MFFFQFQGSACKHDRFYCVIYFEWSTHSYWNTHCFCEFEIDVSDLCFAYILLECFQTVINSFDLNVIYDTWFTIKTLVSKFRWLCIEIRNIRYMFVCIIQDYYYVFWFWRYLTRGLIWQLSQSSITPSIYFSSIVKSCSNPFLEPISTKQ